MGNKKLFRNCNVGDIVYGIDCNNIEKGIIEFKVNSIEHFDGEMDYSGCGGEWIQEHWEIDVDSEYGELTFDALKNNDCLTYEKNLRLSFNANKTETHIYVSTDKQKLKYYACRKIFDEMDNYQGAINRFESQIDSLNYRISEFQKEIDALEKKKDIVESL